MLAQLGLVTMLWHVDVADHHASLQHCCMAHCAGFTYAVLYGSVWTTDMHVHACTHVRMPSSNPVARGIAATKSISDCKTWMHRMLLPCWTCHVASCDSRMLFNQHALCAAGQECCLLSSFWHAALWLTCWRLKAWAVRHAPQTSATTSD